MFFSPSPVPACSRFRDSDAGKVWRAAGFVGPAGLYPPGLGRALPPSPLAWTPPLPALPLASPFDQRRFSAAGPGLPRSPCALLEFGPWLVRVCVFSLRGQSLGFREGFGLRRGVLFCSVLFCFVFLRVRERRSCRPGRKMSNVRVSNGSPSLERMDARQGEHPKPSACRNLFGPVDHEELTRDLEKHCRDMEEASQRKWNFDFQNHRPLEGKYEWQEVEKGSLPEFYYRPPRPPKGACKVPAQESQDVSGSRPAAPLIGAPANPEDTHLVDPKTDPSDSQTGLAEQCAGIRKRPATDDSSTQNKRANRTEENVSDGSPNAGSVEQTPKKPGLRRRQT